MKKTLIFACMFFAFMQLRAQNLDSLFNAHVQSYEPEGYVIFKPNTVPPGLIFTVFSDYYADYPNNKFELVKTTTDELLGWAHRKYQQTYLGKKVEGAEFVEHTNLDGYVDFINGKVVNDFQGDPWESTMSESTALEHLFTKLQESEEYEFSWMNEEWEEDYRTDMGDPEASSYPVGELMWALHRFDSLGHFIPAAHYTLAWRFKIKSLSPAFEKAFFVDAITGDVFREEDLLRHNGPANILTLGNRTIDTRWYGGFVDKFILHTNDSGRNIETRYWKNNLSWGSLDHITDLDDDWGNHHQLATAPHYMASQAWDYFKVKFGRNGMDHDYGRIRIVANEQTNNNIQPFGLAHSDYVSNYDLIHVGHGANNAYAAVIDMMGHEFTHGIIRYSSKLAGDREAGAVAESFCDIFGTMIEKREADAYSGVTFDWLIGEDMMVLRSMKNPKAYNHPNTYQGLYWENTNCNNPDVSNDWCGIHGNNGVMNYWFYLLSEGGSGTNDNGLNYSVEGIGMDNAARIAYGALVFPALTSTSGFPDARQATLNMARLFFGGECNNFFYEQTERAWAAVGLGMPKCTTMGIDELRTGSKPKIYPNPTANAIFIKFTEPVERTINIYSMNGSMMKSFKSNNTELKIYVAELPNGIYIIQVMDEFNVYTEKLIKQ